MMALNRKEQICQLLKGIETGDPASVSVVNEARYIQHNPQTHEGSEGLAVLFKRLSQSNPKVNIVRVFEDGDFVFAHTEYDFSDRNIGFEIFRFEGSQATEHWDNIQRRLGPNDAGHSMVDGPTEVVDQAMTETNRHVIQSFVEDVLIANRSDALAEYIQPTHYTEHNPHLGDDLTRLHTWLFNTGMDEEGSPQICYKHCHRLLAEGNFVLSVCEGLRNQVPTSFFDLYRLESGHIVEHWDTTEAIPARSQWKNNNGKF